MPTTDKQLQWDRENTIQVKLKLNKTTDADIIAWLAAQASKQGAIKQLIRESIAKRTGD